MRRAALLALLLLVAPAATRAQYVEPDRPPPPPALPPEEPDELPPPPPPGALPPAQQAVPEWSVRRLRLWGTLGGTVSQGQGALSLGAGVGYFVVGGLLPTLDLSLAVANGGTVFQLKPGLDWFLPVPGGIVPYLGGYWAHAFASGLYLPQDAWGVRGGLSFASVGPATFLVGVAYERVYTNCVGTCGYWVPQVAAGFAL